MQLLFQLVRHLQRFRAGVARLRPGAALDQGRRRVQDAGFSLAEVAIALAIAAGGFVALLGLLPQGLEMSRRTAEMAARTRIVERLAGELMTTPWAELSWSGHGSDAASRRYFDDQGVEISAAAIGSGQMLSYVASLYLPPPASGDMAVRLPFTTQGNGSDERFVRRVLICIASTTDKDFVFPEPDSLPRQVSCHTLIIPEMGIPPTQP